MISAASARRGDPKDLEERSAVQRWRLFAIVGAVSLLLDQLSKWWAVQSLRPVGQMTVVRGVLDFQFSLNPGAAWSFLGDQPAAFRRWFFLTTTVIACAFITWLYARAKADQKALRWALSLLFGGALGNFVDRVQTGQVVDFIAVRFVRYPTFNIADIAITFGLFALVWDIFSARKKAKSSEESGRGGQRAAQRRRKKR